jgi:DNA-directed RNA polymerase specialized sigma24 family protein
MSPTQDRVAGSYNSEEEVMPRGVAQHDYKNATVDREQLEAFLEKSNYEPKTKMAIKHVLVDKATYKEAAALCGVSRQRVFDRVKNCCQRMGLDTAKKSVAEKVAERAHLG